MIARPRPHAADGDDTRGVAVLRQQLRGALHGVLRGDDPDYEDVLQSALVQILSARRRGSFRGEGSLEGWGRAIARNVAVDRVRARMREQRIFAGDEDVEAAAAQRPAGASPDRLADARRQLSRYVGALSKLRAEKAVVVYLHDVLGHDLTEIARVLGVSVAAAQSRLVRGRGEIAACLTTQR
ncbi:MAG: RNA polymerase sigma factor [Polyangiaceae bacterium]